MQEQDDRNLKQQQQRNDQQDLSHEDFKRLIQEKIHRASRYSAALKQLEGEKLGAR